MSYGLKYIASFESEPLGYYYEIKILERDYTGKASKRNLGGAPELRKDNNGAICGTSLEFLLETTFNGDLREFYTEDNKKLKVEVWRDGILFWVGFVVTEVYEEEMSYMSDIAIRATDGLGLLKTEDYDLTGEQLIWGVIKYCADKSGLILGWDVRTSIQRKSPAESILQSCKINAEIFNDRKNCYEVLTDLLNTLGCYITQSRGNWVISHYVKDSQIGFFTPDFEKRTDISRDSYSFSIGAIDSPDAFSFPVGSLTMSVEPSRKELTVIQQYKTYPSFFANWNFADQSAWSGSGQYVEIDAVNCRYIPGIFDKFSKCFTQVVSLANSVGSSFYLEVKYAVITNNVSADHEIKIVLKQAYTEGIPIELTANGWIVSPSESDRMNLHVEKLSGRSGKIEWNTFKIYANGLAGSGDLTIELYNAKGKPNNDSYVGVYYAEVRAMVEIPGEVEKKISFNTKASESEDVKLAFGDAYSVENTESITANAIRTGTEVAKGNWMINTIDNISGSFHHVLSVLYANRYNKARRKLEGTLLCKGKIPELCLESNFYYTEDKKDYRAISGEMNLLTDEISVELLEIYYPKALPAASALHAVRSADVTDGTYRAAGPMDYRTYQAGPTDSEPKMIRELDRAQDNEVGTDSLLEIDTIIPKKSKSVSLGQLKRCLLGEWFYEKDGRLFCKLDFISEGGVSAYGSGPEGGGLTVDLVDNLISTRTDAGLTANMGRYLKTLIDGKASSWDTITGKPSIFPTNWGSVTGKPDLFPPAAHSHPYLPLIGGTLSGSLTATTIVANGYLRSISNSHTIQIGSQNLDYCHYSTTANKHWFNKSVYISGDVYAGTNYNRRLAYADELTNSVLYNEVAINAIGLDPNKWYPVSVYVGNLHKQTEIRIIVSLNQNKPSWATHASGFSCRFIETVNGGGWGTNPVNRRILCNDYSFAPVNPIGGVTQNTLGSFEIIYVRGGGYYYFHVSTGEIPVLHTLGYNWVSGTYSYSAPVRDSALNDNWAWTGSADLINRANRLRTARTLWGQSFDGTGNVSGRMSDIDGLTSVGSESASTTISGRIGSPVNGVIAKYSVKWYNEYWEWLYYRGGSVDIQNIVLALNGTQKYRFDRSGNFLAVGEITAYSASDRRLKENIRTLTGRASNFLRKLNPVEFDWNDTAMKLNPARHQHDYSFLADEYGEVFPFAVSTIYEKYQAIDTKILLPLLVAGHNETTDEIARLKDRIKILETEIKQLR